MEGLPKIVIGSGLRSSHDLAFVRFTIEQNYVGARAWVTSGFLTEFDFGDVGSLSVIIKAMWCSARRVQVWRPFWEKQMAYSSSDRAYWTSFRKRGEPSATRIVNSCDEVIIHCQACNLMMLLSPDKPTKIFSTRS